MKRKWLKFVLTGVFVAGLVGSSYAEGVKFDGELRVRGVSVNNEDGVNPVKDDGSAEISTLKDGGFFEQRTRLNAGADVDENTKVFIQIQDSRMWGAEASTTTTGDEGSNCTSTSTSTSTFTATDTADTVKTKTTTTCKNGQAIDISQGYIEMNKLFGQPLSLRLGRQALAYGEHRLIGSLEWSNNARRFDALKLTYQHDIANVDVFWAKVMDEGADLSTDNNLLGVYASLKVVPQNDVDVYLLDKIDGTTGEKFYTLGGRVKGEVKSVNIDYNAELAIQTGDAADYTDPTTKAVTGVDKSANAYAIRAGYSIPDLMGLRIGVEYDAATGDEDVAPAKLGTAAVKAGKDGKDKAFDNLYPTNHYLYGFNDDINWTNIKAMSVNASVKPMDKVKVAVEYWKYNKAEVASGSDDMGTEINVKANHEMSKKVNCELAYVSRDNGDAAKTASYGGYGNIDKDKSATFAYFMINVKFN